MAFRRGVKLSPNHTVAEAAGEAKDAADIERAKCRRRNLLVV
jgi:hypothetical protein